MRKPCLRWGVFVALWAYAVLGAAVELRIAYNDVDNAPYMTGAGLLPANPPGIAVDLANQAAEKIGVKIVWERLPGKRLLMDGRSGRIDAILMLSYSDERAQDLVYPMKNGQPDKARRIGYLTYSLYHMQGSPVQWDGSRLQGITGSVGANTGYSVVDALKQMGLVVEEAKETHQNFKKLMLKRVQAVAAQDIMADYLLRGGGFEGVEKITPQLSGKDYYTAFSKSFASRNPALMEQFWSQLAQLRDKQTQALLPLYVNSAEQ